MREQQLGALSLTQGLVEVRRYEWDTDEALTFHRQDYMLSRVVSRRSSAQRIAWHLPCTGKGVPAMQISVVAPEYPVDVAFDQGDALVISCILDPRYFRDATGISHWNEQYALACLGLSSPIISLIFDRLAYEVRFSRKGSGDVAQHFIGALTSELSRGLLRSLGDRQPGELASWQLQRIYDLAADETLELRLTVKQIAEECGISTRHLMRAFKTTTGLTLHQYLNEARMQRAMKLLQSVGEPVKGIAARLGFSTPSAFSAAFLQSVGLTPREYRAGLGQIDRRPWQALSGSRYRGART